MEKMIMIPEERYNKMLISYDEAIAELVKLREELREAKAGVAVVGKD